MRIKRWIAGILCICLLGTSDAFVVQAASFDTQSSEEQEILREEEVQKETTQDLQDETEQDVQEVDEETQNVDEETQDVQDKDMTEQASDNEAATEIAEESEEELPEETAEKSEQETAVETTKISYAVIDQPYITTPGTQNVVVGIGNDDTVIENAVLEYRNRTTGEVAEIEAKTILGNAVLFTMEFLDESESGIYELSTISYTIDKTEYKTTFADAGMEMLFGVNQEVESNPDGVVVEEESDVDIDVVTIDEDGNTTSKNSISEAIEEVQTETTGLSRTVTTYGSKNGNIVVLLDPGHDANHPGASYNGLVEKDINLKIAQYCKAELETYAGVTVDMTREGDACPYSTGDASVCNAKRVEYAKSIGADIYVSIHNNASGVGATGSEVYYPNANYNAQISAAGKDTAEKILAKLAELGLKNRGVKIRNSENGTTYPDGTPADYYGVIKNCKYAGIPAIIVEHAFMDSSDAANFLNSDSKLKKLGIADATGIAQHFGLKKKPSGPPPAKPKKTEIISAKSAGDTTIKISWEKVDKASGYNIYRSTKKDSGFKKIAVISSGSTTSYKDKGVNAGKTYYYKIKTRATANEQNSYSGYCSVRAAKTVKSTSITSVKSVGDKKLQIKWKKESGANGYYIYRSTKKDSGFQKIATISDGSTVSYQDVSIKAGKSYYYKIKCRNKKDGSTGSSSYSNIVRGKTVAAPQISYVKSKSNKKLEVVWNEIKGANGYYIYRSTSKNKNYKKIATIRKAETVKYSDTDIKAGKTYYYKIKARNKISGKTGYSSYSSIAYGKTVVDTDIQAVRSKSSKKLEISWKAVSDANGYYIYRSTSKDKNYQKIATVSGKNTVTYVDASLKTGKKYYYKIRTRNKVNGKSGYSSYSDVKSGKTIAKTSIESLKYSSNAATIKWKAVDGVTGYQIKRSESKNGTYSTIATVSGESQVSYKDKTVQLGKTYYYKVRAIKITKKVTGYGSYTSVKSVGVGSKIMGASTVTVDQMVAYYNHSGKTYPSATYSSKGAANIKTFCNIVVQEATAEGVRADVVFAQICNETGFLQFGGDVQPEQCNFAGLGATGGGVQGETFKDVRTGIRAQVQHLKAYASKDPLNKTCVDNRFSYVTRGCAPFVEWLGIQENPYGKGWAAAKNYGYTLMNMVKTMQTM